MLRLKRSEHTRRLVLDAALDLFSHQGYRATTIREIADAAKVSTGNLYHHFPDKESIFRTLIDEYRAITESPRFPLVRALQTGTFPENLELIGRATKESVEQYRRYMVLHYVDIIEFEGQHIRNFYKEIGQRFVRLVASNEELAGRLRKGVSPRMAYQVATRLFLSYIQIEILWGVAEPFGGSTTEVIKEMADIIRYGIVLSPGS